MVYVLCKTLFGSKALRIRFDEVDEFIRVYDGIRYLVLFCPEKYDVIYNTTRYLITQKVALNMFFSHNYAKIKVNSYDSLPQEKNIDFVTLFC